MKKQKLQKHHDCVKRVGIWSYSGLHFSRIRTEYGEILGHCSASLRCDYPFSEFFNLVNAALDDMELYHFLKFIFIITENMFF